MTAPAAPVRPSPVKKLSAGQRRRRTDYSKVGSGPGRLFMRLRDDHEFLRSWIQGSFALLCIWIGIEFYLFVQWGASGGAAAYVSRPPGSEGFLP
ncbi:MAG: hypothetical protein OEV30_12535, partial [Ignavibacteria bacterium]|nr:hypothetical protein [Ignavibacteria bacterium]